MSTERETNIQKNAAGNIFDRQLLDEAFSAIEHLIQNCGYNQIPFQNLLEKANVYMHADILMVDKKGVVLHYIGKQILNSLGKKLEEGMMLDAEDQMKLRRIEEMTVNAYTGSADSKIYYMIMPLYSKENRLGTVIFAGKNAWSQDCLYFMRLLTMCISREYALNEYREDVETRKLSETVHAAIATLSYSELSAMVHVINGLNGKEGLVIASKLADQVGVARSVIVNALRKFESAGIIESRSLGVKGTFIRVINPILLEEFQRYRNMI